MSRPAKLLLSGIALGLLVVAVGHVGTARAKRDVDELRMTAEAIPGNFPPTDWPEQLEKLSAATRLDKAAEVYLRAADAEEVLRILRDKAPLDKSTDVIVPIKGHPYVLHFPDDGATPEFVRKNLLAALLNDGTAMYQITSPDGQKYRLRGPLNATPEEVDNLVEKAKERLHSSSQPASGSTPPATVAEHVQGATGETNQGVGEGPPVQKGMDEWVRQETSQIMAQLELHKARRHLAPWQSFPFGGSATAVAALFAAPWLWYFVLDRVRELSTAIRGR